MLRHDYPGQTCSIAKALEVVGERWTLLIVRDVMTGIAPFDELQKSLGVARNVLSARLQRLVEEDILERRAYQESPERHEYFLTEKGLDLWPALIALLGWGDRHSEYPDGPPLLSSTRSAAGRSATAGSANAAARSLTRETPARCGSRTRRWPPGAEEPLAAYGVFDSERANEEERWRRRLSFRPGTGSSSAASGSSPRARRRSR